MTNNNILKPATGVLSAFALSMTLSTNVMADSNPFVMSDLKTGYMLAEHGDGKCGEAKCGESMKKVEGKCGEAKCGESMKKAEGKCGEGKCGGKGKGVDMAGNVVDLGNFQFGGDNMGKYADGKIGTGTKDPGVCGSFSAAKCSVGHLK